MVVDIDLSLLIEMHRIAFLASKGFMFWEENLFKSNCNESIIRRPQCVHNIEQNITTIEKIFILYQIQK